MEHTWGQEEGAEEGCMQEAGGGAPAFSYKQWRVTEDS